MNCESHNETTNSHGNVVRISYVRESGCAPWGGRPTPPPSPIYHAPHDERPKCLNTPYTTHMHRTDVTPMRAQAHWVFTTSPRRA